MNARAARILYYALLTALALTLPVVNGADAPANNTATVQIGDSLEAVKSKLGEPRSELGAGSRTVLIYPQGQIVLLNGQVNEIPTGLLTLGAMPPPHQPAATPTKPATAPDATSTFPPDITVVEHKDEDGVITLIAQSETNTYFTVTVDATLTNMTPSHPLPFSTDSGGQKSFVLIQFRRDDPSKAWNCPYHYDVRRGGIREAKTNEATYLLPYQTTETHRLVQGNFGKFSHFAGSQNEYAFDFECPQGTVVCAARAGIVSGVRQDYTAGGTDEKFKSQGNYIIIRHDDGTFAEYFHIQHHGALVQLGQRVGSGQHIALSGATGYATSPHIHFDVFQNTDGKTRITLPVKFKTDQGVLDSLKEGQTY